MSPPPLPPPLAPRSAGIAEYVKHAFLYRWNMLLFLGGTAAAVLSPWPDALLPLVGAAEMLYLGGLVASSKFRDAIDAKLHQEARGRQTKGGAVKIAKEAPRGVQEILSALPPEARRRFEQVRARCLEMRAIASGVRGRAGPVPEPGHELSTPALDRLLWVFLRLLVSQDSLSRFLNRTNIEEIRSRLADAKSRLEKSQGDERIARSLQDSVAAQELRIQNYEKSKGNLEYVRVELDRIEAKIQVLAESSVNRQDPDFLSSQIDSVTESMQSTERAISELQQLTGLVDEMQEPPAILESDLGRVVES